MSSRRTQGLGVRPGSSRARQAVLGLSWVLAAAAAQPVWAADDGADSATPRSTHSKRDPYERFNRSVFAFNESIDAAVVKPVAETYRKLVPQLVRTGVDNVLGNLGDVWSAVNHLLQGKITGATQMTMRVASNTVFGLGGLLDPATDMGLERQPEDFGQTLGRWGVPAGPYLVLPLLGPSSVRDASATPINMLAGPTALIHTTTAGTIGITSVQLVSARAGLLGATQLLDEIAFDKYSFLRDAYLSRRQSLVYDGNPPEEDDDEDPPPAPSAPASAAPPATPPASAP